MANPFPFVAGSVLTAAELNGIGETTSFTPVFTNFTLGNGTAVGTYTRVQNLVKGYVEVVLGSTSSVTGTWRVDLPIATTIAYDLQYAGLVRYVDSGTQTYVGFCNLTSNTQLTFTLFSPSGSYLVSLFASTSAPFTWTTGDSLYASFVYEVA